MTVQLQVVATKGVGAKAGFKVPVVSLELGGDGSRQWQNTSTITVVLDPPVDRNGMPVKVTSTTTVSKG
ncbi:hypothetical protein HEB94_005713 [Actinopolymorpha pittospori]|uniref:Trypsin-co-occurring domain-containing protein n=1 Tax=Actinopolymorpha pittospori TaxID=648752 RepID=A0A927RE64_9ACTN|nr:hypothetical protein [Actinopolymorpha pittospori]